jgi:Cys/Met metabolism PLP-dependent enzyme
MRAFGAMIAVEVDSSPDDARRFLERCRLFTLAESLGGVESLISLPALMTHASTLREVRAALAITDRLVRISVGIEDDDDVIADLNASFATVRTPSPGDGEALFALPPGSLQQNPASGAPLVLKRQSNRPHCSRHLTVDATRLGSPGQE